MKTLIACLALFFSLQSLASDLQWLKGSGPPQKLSHSVETQRAIEGASNWTRVRDQMLNEGFVLIDQQTPTRQITEEEKSKLIPFAEVAPKLGYRPISVVGTPLDGNLVGVMLYLPDEKGRHHQVAYLFDVPDLGYVYLNEDSYATNPGLAGLGVGAAFGNVSVNDQPGSFILSRNEAGTVGQTDVWIALNGKWMNLRVYRPLLPGTSERTIFDEITQALN